MSSLGKMSSVYQPTFMLDPVAHPDLEITHGRAWTDADRTVRLGYTDVAPRAGTDRTILLLHGAPQTRYAWRKVLAPFAAAGYRVIAPDVRGAGASTKTASGYDKWTMAADVHRLAHEVLGVAGPISVIGHDLGSMLALGYLLRYRDDVRNALLMEAPLPGTEYYERRKVSKSAWHFDFHANVDIAEHLTAGRERWYIQRFYDDLAYQPGAITEADVDVYARAFEAPGAMRALFEHYRALDEDAARNRAAIEADGRLTMPILAIGGGEQALARNYLDMTREIAADVTGDLIPGSGHWVAEENPAALVSAFVAFDRR